MPTSGKRRLGSFSNARALKCYDQRNLPESSHNERGDFRFLCNRRVATKLAPNHKSLPDSLYRCCWKNNTRRVLNHGLKLRQQTFPTQRVGNLGGPACLTLTAQFPAQRVGNLSFTPEKWQFRTHCVRNSLRRKTPGNPTRRVGFCRWPSNCQLPSSWMRRYASWSWPWST